MAHSTTTRNNFESPRSSAPDPLHHFAPDTLMDYTRVGVDLLVEGHLSSGQPTRNTARCPKCGRVGVTAERDDRLLVVHKGYAVENTLEPTEYCEIPAS
jgi:hypothetical protein